MCDKSCIQTCFFERDRCLQYVQRTWWQTVATVDVGLGVFLQDDTESSIASKTSREVSQIAKFMGPTWAHLGPVGPRWAPCWPHESCYQGCSTFRSSLFLMMSTRTSADTVMTRFGSRIYTGLALAGLSRDMSTHLYKVSLTLIYSKRLDVISPQNITT